MQLLKFPKEVKSRMMGANRQDWCEFHKAYGHSMEECRTLDEKDPISPRSTRKGNRDELARDGRENTRREERQRERSRSGQRRDT
ncbi:hypothetical protein CR513_35363, partial [Mucuna pruriens]